MDGIERSCPGRAGGHSSALAKSPMVLVMSAPTVASLQKVDCVSPALAGGDIVTSPSLAGEGIVTYNSYSGMGGYCHQSSCGSGDIVTTPDLAGEDIVTTPALAGGNIPNSRNS